jgi:hypothetical protein
VANPDGSLPLLPGGSFSVTANQLRARWLHRLADGVAIVASILLAFGIQAWWESHQDVELERQALSTLTEELDLLDWVLGKADATSHDVAQGAAYLLATRERPDRAPADSVALALAELESMATTDASLTAYDLLVSSGRLDIVENPELTQHLLMLRTLMIVKDRAEAREVMFMNTRLSPLLDAYVDRGRFADLDWYASKGVGRPETQRFPEDFSGLFRDRTFWNLMERRVEYRERDEYFLGRMRTEIAGIRESAKGRFGTLRQGVETGR